MSTGGRGGGGRGGGGRGSGERGSRGRGSGERGSGGRGRFTTGGRGDGGRGDGGRGGGGRGGGRGAHGGDSAPRGSYSRGPRGGDHRGGGFRGGRGGGRGGGGFAPSAGVQTFATDDGVVPPPDANVTRVEDALQKDKGAGLSLGSLHLQATFPDRPGYGTRGNPVVLWANYVEMVTPRQLTLHRYDVSVTPAVVGKKLTQVVRLLLQTPGLVDRQREVVSDFKSTLVCRQRLAGDEDDITIPIIYRAEGQDEPREGATEYRVRLQHTGALAFGEFMDYLTSMDWAAPYDNKLPLIQALNVFLNHHAKVANSLVMIGSSKTFSMTPDAESFDLGAGLAAIRGFFASVRAATCRILVNVNVSHGAFYHTGRLDEVVRRFDRQVRNKAKIATFLKNVRVRTTHLPERRNKNGEVIPRIKSIKGVASPSDGRDLAHPPKVAQFGAGARQIEFWLEETGQSTSSPTPQAGDGKKGKKMGQKGAKTGGPSGSSAPAGPSAPSGSGSGRYISVYDFFQEKYGMQIAQPDLPVVNAGTKQNPTYLPMEVCMVLEGQNAPSKLSPAQTQQMIRFAVRKPWENATSIVRDGLKTVGLSSKTNVLLSEFGLSVSTTLVTVPGRVLNEPKVMYKQKMAQVRFGGWNMVDVQFSAGGNLKKWSYLLISLPEYSDAFDDAGRDEVVQKLARTLSGTGVAAPPPIPGQRLSLQYLDDPQLDAMFARAADASIDLLFVILPDNSPLYDRIKDCGDRKYGIHTICSVGYKLAKERGQDQYLANVALKFNLKLGGVNQQVDASRLGIINEDKTMVVGIDVTHPSPGSSENAPSVAAMVASVDKRLGQWPGVIRIQAEARQEMVSDLCDMLKSRLRLWKQLGKHQALPENILVYRDGVSEGQYQLVLDNELPLLRKACEEMYPPADQKRGLPCISIVIVGKRHHTRFYPTREADADRSSNPKAGTVVDRGVTEARTWDFFLQSHTAIQGTARPAHYVVVHDEIFRARYQTVPPPFRNAADLLEDLTQSMCYTFGRATRAVSICTPAYYADLLCERARRYLRSLFDEASSVAPSTAGASQAAPTGGPTGEEVQIHPKLRDSMFYI